MQGLVSIHCEYSKGANAHEIAEFFILQKYRRQGIGKDAARAVFEKHKGQWEVLQLPNNLPAQKFWKSVVSEYTNGNYKECGSGTEKWVGFLFEN